MQIVTIDEAKTYVQSLTQESKQAFFQALIETDDWELDTVDEANLEKLSYKVNLEKKTRRSPALTSDELQKAIKLFEDLIFKAVISYKIMRDIHEDKGYKRGHFLFSGQLLYICSQSLIIDLQKILNDDKLNLKKIINDLIKNGQVSIEGLEKEKNDFYTRQSNIINRIKDLRNKYFAHADPIILQKNSPDIKITLEEIKGFLIKSKDLISKIYVLLHNEPSVSIAIDEESGMKDLIRNFDEISSLRMELTHLDFARNNLPHSCRELLKNEIENAKKSLTDSMNSGAAK